MSWPRPCRVALAVAIALFAIASREARGQENPAEPAQRPATTPTSTEPPNKPRHESTEPTEIEVLNFVDEVDRDPQAFAAGLSAGVGGLVVKGSHGAVPAANFAFTFDFGLGPGGARVPWSIEPFAAFSLTRASFDSDIRSFPDRFTELGGRVVYRGSGALDGHFVSLGTGLAWTGSGYCSQPNPAPCEEKHSLQGVWFVELGVGVVEWQVRGARYGFGAALPVEISRLPGGGLFAFFYGQLGLGR